MDFLENMNFTFMTVSDDIVSILHDFARSVVLQQKECKLWSVN